MLKTTTKTLLLSTLILLPLQAEEKTAAAPAMKCAAGKCGSSMSTPKVAKKPTVSAHEANSAAYTLLATMNMKESYEGMIERVTQMQLQANPGLESVKSTIHGFFSKYMGWEAQRGDIAALYAKNYTADELKELNKFYQTPLGQKTVQLMPQLAAAGAKIGQSKLASHMGELKTMIDEAMAKTSTAK
jgi:hypothetical protein